MCFRITSTSGARGRQTPSPRAACTPPARHGRARPAASRADRRRRRTAALRARARAARSIIDSIELLSYLTRSQRKELVENLRTHRVPAGTKLLEQGTAGSSFYIIQSGECTVMQTVDGGASPVVIATLEMSGYFGERSLLKDEPCNATVRIHALPCVEPSPAATVRARSRALFPPIPFFPPVPPLSSLFLPFPLFFPFPPFPPLSPFLPFFAFRPRAYVAQVVAKTDCVLMRLGMADFRAILGKNLQDIIDEEIRQREDLARQAVVGATGLAFHDLELLSVLGEGSFGRVKLVRRRASSARARA